MLSDIVRAALPKSVKNGRLFISTCKDIDDGGNLRGTLSVSISMENLDVLYADIDLDNTHYPTEAAKVAELWKSLRVKGDWPEIV